MFLTRVLTEMLQQKAISMPPPDYYGYRWTHIQCDNKEVSHKLREIYTSN